MVIMRESSFDSSSSSSPSASTLTHEHRSSDAKNAATTLLPNHLARPSTFPWGDADALVSSIASALLSFPFLSVQTFARPRVSRERNEGRENICFL